MSSSITEIETVSIRRLLWRYSTPAIIAMIASSLYNLVDTIFIGQCAGSLALTGVTVAKPFMDILAAFGTLVGVGGSAYLSIILGEKNYTEANKVLANVIIFNILIGALITVVGLLFLEPILYSFGASENTLSYAKDYMEVILYGNILTHIYFGLNNILRSMGKPKVAMYSTIIAVVLNIFLDYFFVYKLNMGIRGAAWGTVISQFTAICLQIYIFCNPNTLLHFQRGLWHPSLTMAKKIFPIGIAPFLMNVAHCFVVVVINNQLKSYGGDMAIASYGIINRLVFIFAMIVMGLNQGMQPIVGYNYGARHYDRMWQTFKLTAYFATIITGTMFFLGECFPELLARMFTPEEDLITQTINPMRILVCMNLLAGFQMVTTNFFTSIGEVKKAIFLSLTRQVLYLIPLCLILPHFFGINGVWMSQPSADFLAAITTTILLAFELRKMRD